MVKKIVAVLYGLLLSALGGAISLAVLRKRCDSVLLIRLDSIGDFVLWLDSARYFRKIYPDRKIVLLANHVWSDFAEKFPHWDEVWPLDLRKFHRDLPYRMRMLEKIRNAGFDVAVHPVFSRRFLDGDAVVQVCGATERIGSAGDYSNISRLEKKIGDLFYTRLIPASQHPMMELKRNAEFMRGIGIDTDAALPDISPAIKGVKNPLNNVNGYYVMFPGAGWTGRQWPVTHFATLAEKIYRLQGITAVVCGNAVDRQLAETIVSMASVPVINLAGKTRLAELAVVIRDASFLIGNETSAVHLAAALSTPSFCLQGGGHYGRFIPYDLDEVDDRLLPVPIIHKMDCFGCNWHCRYRVKKNRPVPCIERIKVDEVVNALTAAGNSLT